MSKSNHPQNMQKLMTPETELVRLQRDNRFLGEQLSMTLNVLRAIADSAPRTEPGNVWTIQMTPERALEYANKFWYSGKQARGTIDTYNSSLRTHRNLKG